MRAFITMLVLCCTLITAAQTTITGSAYDIYLEPLPGVTIKAETGSATTDIDGNFTLTVNQKLPFTIKVLGFGYQTQEVEIVKNNQKVNPVLKAASKLEQVVISASRTPERVLESPVTVSRFNHKDIKNTSSTDFYTHLANLKEVDVQNINQYTKIANTRGFASLENTRFVQMVDGADTANPAFGFSLGNLTGINELDVRTVEVLPGAASALYGANAFNGIMLVRSKNPFEHGGISTYYKTGVTAQDEGNRVFHNTSIRMAHAFDKKFAAKVNFDYTSTDHWDVHGESDHAKTNIDSQTGFLGFGSREENSDYNGIAILGDEEAIDINSSVAFLESLGAFTPGTAAQLPLNRVSRPGFEIHDLEFGEKHQALKFDGSLYYRPTGKEDLEMSFTSKFALGDFELYSENKYELENAFSQHHQFNLKSKIFDVNAYYINQDLGNSSYNSNMLANNINTSFKPRADWYLDYLGSYVDTYFTELGGGATQEEANQLANIAGRDFAQAGFPEGAAFENRLNQVKNTNISDGGARIRDNSSIYNVEANLNLTDVISWADIQLGGVYRENVLNSNGQLFNDALGTIRIPTYGAYAQVIEKLADERLRLTASIRYDKSKNFDGNYSPRVSVTYASGKKRNHNFRGSYQTAFRTPSALAQYASTFIGAEVYRVGSVQDNLDNYISPDIYIFTQDRYINLTGDQIFNNSYSLDSQQEYIRVVTEDLTAGTDLGTAIATNVGILEIENHDPLRAEKVKSFELGYRGAIDLAGGLFEVDFNAYYSSIEDYIVSEIVVTPTYGDVNAVPNNFDAPTSVLTREAANFSIKTNHDEEVSFYGAAVALSTQLLKKFDLGVNYTWASFATDDHEDEEHGFKAGFNTPEHRFKLSFGSSELFKNVGFNVNARWQNEFLWETNYVSDIIEARTELDAQVNFRIPKLKSTLKLGAMNLLGKEYYTAPGLPTIGSTYFASWTIND